MWVRAPSPVQPVRSTGPEHKSLITEIPHPSRYNLPRPNGLVLSDSFHLRKWYFDCVSPTGDAAILYLARLRWRSAVLNYASLLLLNDGQIITRSSVRRFKSFDDTLDHLELKLPNLNISASLHAQQPPINRTILNGVTWTCLHPKSDVSIVAGSITLRGLGYAERLDLTIPPWKLPLHELHWGRFLSPEDSLVWIDWRGQHQTTVLIHNGRDVHPEHIGADEIRFEPASTLTLDRRHILRTGHLGQTVLPAAPALNRFFPRNVFNIRETKWCSVGKLTAPDHASAGWAIHEIVEWPS
jgi:hypothetical protein